MIVFVFLVTTYLPGQLPIVAVEDFNLSGADCIQRLVDHEPVPRSLASCEVDLGVEMS